MFLKFYGEVPHGTSLFLICLVFFLFGFVGVFRFWKVQAEAGLKGSHDTWTSDLFVLFSFFSGCIVDLGRFRVRWDNRT